MKSSFCEKCESFDCRCSPPGYSGGKDYQIGAYGRNGRFHEEEKSGFSKQEKANSGLTERKPL